MLGTDVLVVEPLGFLGSICQNAFAFVAERQIHRRGYFLPWSSVPLDLFADRLHGRVRTKEAVCQRLVLAQQPQQQMFGLDIRTAEHARLIAAKEDGSSGLFVVSLEHIRTLPQNDGPGKRWVV